MKSGMLSEALMAAFEETHNDAVLTALAVLQAVVDDDELFEFYVDRMLKRHPLPGDASTDDLRTMLSHEEDVLRLLYHDAIMAAKAEAGQEVEECESSVSESALTSTMRVF